eukprot:m.272538 g.272538  ORF g.272538 m.272538 type:complete len:71 (-) comp17678_c0_seq14:113-325(-)
MKGRDLELDASPSEDPAGWQLPTMAIAQGDRYSAKALTTELKVSLLPFPTVVPKLCQRTCPRGWLHHGHG